ncbi:hypothetical protein E2C01_044838 [Portunus trituberculatus]|uniref:Uncharacterized protein n=1 Tax=Portunus trituberculatus TaxID=210409 RepID=A0A5B7FU44_PORTR|nr:hypothetical protein [Portunus trituberculatus]
MRSFVNPAQSDSPLVDRNMVFLNPEWLREGLGGLVINLKFPVIPLNKPPQECFVQPELHVRHRLSWLLLLLCPSIPPVDYRVLALAPCNWRCCSLMKP